jgi:hypothetical protein
MARQGVRGRRRWSVYRKGSARETQAANSEPISYRRTTQQGPLASATGLICRTCTASVQAECKCAGGAALGCVGHVCGNSSPSCVISVAMRLCNRLVPLSAQQLGFSTAGRVQGAVLKSQGFRTGAPAPLTVPCLWCSLLLPSAIELFLQCNPLCAYCLYAQVLA